MKSRGGVKAEVRVMEVLERRLFEAQPAVEQQRRGPQSRGLRSHAPVELLRFGPAGAQLGGQDALDAEVRQASVHESRLRSGMEPAPFQHR